MTVSSTNSRPPGGAPAADAAVGGLLRQWRQRRQISQLELALRADSSARHISFVETGRSKPSREMVLRLAEHLDVPVRDRNELLVAAGFAPAYPATPLDAPEMSTVRDTLDGLLTAYEPYPALVLDGRYDVVGANRGVQALLAGVAPELLRPPLNALRVTLHPQGLAPRIRNLGEWREHLLHRTGSQLAARPSAALREVFEEVSRYPVPASCGDAHPRHDPAGTHRYALPMVIEVGGEVLSFLSTVATFNTPMDVTVSELAVESFLPATPETARALRALVDAQPALGGAVPAAR